MNNRLKIKITFYILMLFAFAFTADGFSQNDQLSENEKQRIKSEIEQRVDNYCDAFKRMDKKWFRSFFADDIIYAGDGKLLAGYDNAIAESLDHLSENYKKVFHCNIINEGIRVLGNTAASCAAILLAGMLLSFSLNRVNPKKEEKQIRQLWREAGEHLRTGNWEGYKNCWKQTSEIEVIHPAQGEWLKGWDQVSEKYRKLLQSGVRFTMLKDDVTLNISESGDMAWGTIDVIFQIGEDKTIRYTSGKQVLLKKSTTNGNL